MSDKSKAGRKPAAPAEVVDVPMNTTAIAEAGQAATELGRHLADVTARFSDGQAYDRTRLVNEARFYMGQSAEAMLEAGKRLIVLKENELHGEFTNLLEQRLGLNERTARRMMAAALKYLSPALEAKRTTLSVLGKSKLLELMVEDDVALDDLADGGSIAGLDLDDIQAMSTRELRDALRKERDDRKKDAAAKDKVIAKKDSKLNELEETLARRESLTPNEAEQHQLDTVRDSALQAEMALRQLVLDAGQVINHPTTEVAGVAGLQAVQFIAQVFAGALAEHGVSVDFAELVTPHWLAGATPAEARKGRKA